MTFFEHKEKGCSGSIEAWAFLSSAFLLGGINKPASCLATIKKQLDIYCESFVASFYLVEFCDGRHCYVDKNSGAIIAGNSIEDLKEDLKTLNSLLYQDNLKRLADLKPECELIESERFLKAWKGGFAP